MLILQQGFWIGGQFYKRRFLSLLQEITKEAGCKPETQVTTMRIQGFFLWRHFFSSQCIFLYCSQCTYSDRTLWAYIYYIIAALIYSLSRSLLFRRVCSNSQAFSCVIGFNTSFNNFLQLPFRFFIIFFLSQTILLLSISHFLSSIRQYLFFQLL